VATDGPNILQTKYSYSREDAEAAVIEFVENYTRLNDYFAQRAEDDTDVAAEAAVVADETKTPVQSSPPDKALTQPADVQAASSSAQSQPKGSAVTSAYSYEAAKFVFVKKSPIPDWMAKANAKEIDWSGSQPLSYCKYSRLKHI
jgi:hypothetical protein